MFVYLRSYNEDSCLGFDAPEGDDSSCFPYSSLKMTKHTRFIVTSSLNQLLPVNNGTTRTAPTLTTELSH